MISSVLVVVILGAVIAAITRAVLVDEQPATAEAPRGGAPRPLTALLGASAAIEPDPDADDVEAGTDTVVTVSGHDGDEAEGALEVEDVAVATLPAGRGAVSLRAARAAFLLALSVVGLGALTAALLGALVVAGTALVSQALG